MCKDKHFLVGVFVVAVAAGLGGWALHLAVSLTPAPAFGGGELPVYGAIDAGAAVHLPAGLSEAASPVSVAMSASATAL